MKSYLALQFGYLAIGCVALSGCTIHHVDPDDSPAGAGPAAPASPPPSPSQRAVEVPRPLEACNGLDDSGDGVADEGQTCTSVCSKDAVERASAALRLPRDGDVTVPTGSEETPTLLAIQQVPEFCSGVTPLSTEDDVTVGCGEVRDVTGTGIVAKTLRIAPGGVLRSREWSRLTIHNEILVCPGARIESGADIAREEDGKDGSTLGISTERLIMLGVIDTRGGWVTASGGARPGNSGRLLVEVERLLFSGHIDTAGDAPQGYRSGNPGDLDIVVTKESFFSGSVRSGNTWMKMPVCCH